MEMLHNLLTVTQLVRHTLSAEKQYLTAFPRRKESFEVVLIRIGFTHPPGGHFAIPGDSFDCHNWSCVSGI